MSDEVNIERVQEGVVGEVDHESITRNCGRLERSAFFFLTVTPTLLSNDNGPLLSVVVFIELDILHVRDQAGVC